MAKKPETQDTERTQVVASGAVEPRTTNVDDEVKAMGINVNAPIGGHGQGGEGH